MLQCNNVCCQPWSLASGLSIWPAEISRPELPGTTGRPLGPQFCLVSLWLIEGKFLQSFTPCKLLLSLSAARLGAKDHNRGDTRPSLMCKCLSVHMNIYQQGGGFLQFAGKTSSEYFHHRASTYSSSSTEFVLARCCLPTISPNIM